MYMDAIMSIIIIIIIITIKFNSKKDVITTDQDNKSEWKKLLSITLFEISQTIKIKTEHVFHR